MLEPLTDNSYLLGFTPEVTRSSTKAGGSVQPWLTWAHRPPATISADGLRAAG